MPGTISPASLQMASSPETKSTGTPCDAAVYVLSMNSLMRLPLSSMYRLLPVEVWLMAKSGLPAGA